MTDPCSKHARVLSQGPAMETVELEAHPLYARPARLRVSDQKPHVSGRRTVWLVPDGASAAIVMPGNF
jgi:hypothetical protein